MTPKKNPALDYNHLRPLFRSIGLATSMLLVTVIFEWKTYEDDSLVEIATVMNDQYEEVMEIPLTEQPPPPPPKIIQAEIIAVSDEIEIEDLEISLDIEIHESTVIETQEFSPLPVFEEPEEEEVDEIFVVVEQYPEPENGIAAFYRYIQEHMNYPSRARTMNVKGKVFVQFVIFPDGSVRDVEVIKGIGGGCDEEALRVVKESPIRWLPGKQRGVPVKVRMVLPITFDLT